MNTSRCGVRTSPVASSRRCDEMLLLPLQVNLALVVMMALAVVSVEERQPQLVRSRVLPDTG